MSEQAKKAVPKLRFPEFEDAGDWEEKTLDKSLDYQQPTPYLVSDTNYSDAFETPVLTAGKTFILGYTNEQNGIFSDNLPVIIFDDFTTATQFVDFPFKAKSSAMKILLAKSGANIKFMYELMQMIAYEVGTHERHWISKFAPILVLVPSPDEQKKIADCLSSIDELITAQTQKITALKDHKKGLMQQLFPAEGETVPKLRFPEFKDEGDWESKTLAKVCDVLQGYGFPEVLQGKREGKYPFCKVSDISRAFIEKGGILSDATNYIGDDELLKLRAKLIPVGSTVFAKIGEALRLNRRAYVQSECLIDNNATGLKAIKGVAVDYFVYLMSQLIDLNEHCGGAVPSVNKSTLEEIELIVPRPEEQQKIADCLSSLDDVITTQTQKLEALKDHKKGMMQQLFPSMVEVSE